MRLYRSLALGTVVGAAFCTSALAQTEAREATAAASYAGALACADRFAETVVLDEKTTRAVAGQAVVVCEDEKQAAANRLLGAVPELGLDIANQNVEARMRIVANERVIKRLEFGDFVFNGRGDDAVGLNGPAFRYGFCITGAIDKTVAQLHLGDVWFRNTLDRPRPEAEDALIELGRSECPSSRSQYEAAYQATIEHEHPDLVEAVQNTYAPTAMERIVVASYF